MSVSLIEVVFDTVNSSLSSGVFHCNDTTYAGALTVTFVLLHLILVLPVSLLVLCLGLRRRRRGSRSSHSDVFTYHSAAMELLFALGVALYVGGAYLRQLWLEMVGFYATANLLCGQTLFHVLTCVERYLAVVHPVTYLGLRQSGGVRIRSTSTGCVWLVHCGWIGVTVFYYPNLADVPFYCLLASSLVVVSFCSLAVLWVLTSPGPGQRADPAKRRAFHTITAITAVLWLNVLGLLVSLALDNSHLLSYDTGCVVLSCGYMVTLPSNLVLPLLFLQRADKRVSG